MHIYNYCIITVCRPPGALDLRCDDALGGLFDDLRALLGLHPAVPPRSPGALFDLPLLLLQLPRWLPSTGSRCDVLLSAHCDGE